MLNVRPLSPELTIKAKQELNEDPEWLSESIRSLREWIVKEPHLNSRTDDQFLLTFLRASKHSVERAKKKIDQFYTVRTAIPEFFKNRKVDNPKYLEVLRLGTGLILPKPLGDAGPRIILIRAGAYNPDMFTIYEILQPGSLVADIELMEDDNLIVSGLVEIIDFSNVTMAHLFQIDLVFLKKIAALGGEGSPLRHVGTHFINTTAGFETVFNIFKGLLSASRRSRLFVHGDNLESLYNHVPQMYLPEEYGGSNGSIKDIVEHWEKKIMSYADFFKEDDQYRTIEELRVGRKADSGNLFGVDGTFRSLNVD